MSWHSRLETLLNMVFHYQTIEIKIRCILKCRALIARYYSSLYDVFKALNCCSKCKFWICCHPLQIKILTTYFCRHFLPRCRSCASGSEPTNQTRHCPRSTRALQAGTFSSLKTGTKDSYDMWLSNQIKSHPAQRYQDKIANKWCYYNTCR